MARKSKIFEARDINRTVKDVRDERDSGYATLVSHRGKHSTVQMRWGTEALNQAAKDDQMFELQIGTETALLNWEEMLRYGRWL